MKKNPETKNPETEKAAAEKAAEKAKREERKAANAEWRTDEKNLREAFRVDTKVRAARVEIAKALSSGRTSVSFARKVVTLETFILAETADKDRKAVKGAIAAYAKQLEVADPKARVFKSPSKGVLNALDRVYAKSWNGVDKFHAAADASATKAAAAWA